MDRRNFLRSSIGASAGLVAMPAALTWLAGPLAAGASANVGAAEVDEDALAILVAAANQLGAQALGQGLTSGNPRGQARRIRRLVAPFVSPRSAHYHREDFANSIEARLEHLATLQHPDGTFTVGNIQSPPDTGFLIEDFGVMTSLLDADDHPRATPLSNRIKAMMRKAGQGLVRGGIHTPNHRWKLSSALARIHHVQPLPQYVARVDEWLSEGIDQFSDAMYSERSPTYAAEVSNPSLLVIAWVLDRPELLDGVRRNLEMYLYLTESNGEVEAIHSRRQDQDHRLKHIRDFYVQYREFALRDNDGRFASVVKGIEQRDPGQLGDFFADVVERPELASVLPEPEPLPTDYARFFPTAQLARVRRGRTAASIFGGTDWYENGERSHLFNRIGSGISTNPTFLKLRHGNAVLESLRMSPVFFSMGHFRSNGVEVTQQDRYRLHNELNIPYFLPLPPELRRADGDYKHTNTTDGRFFSKLDFPNRPAHYVTLRSQVVIREVASGFDLDFLVDKTDDINVTIELCFRPGGELSGVSNASGANNFSLPSGFGTYRVGDDTITFGPGHTGGSINIASGEQYSVHNGSLSASGIRVYLTGRSRFKHTLQLRFS